ncbi:MAG: ABC transporter ATP-binding protein [Candidatus Kariarchaeaceae archaeon]
MASESVKESEKEKYVIEIEGLEKIYKTGKVRAVDGLNLRIKEGEIYALIGANGSGKTTSINIMTGALYPTAGKIKVLGLEMPKERHTLSRYLGVAPQEYSIYLDMTVEQNIKFYADLYGIRNEAFEKQINHLLDVMKLVEKRKTTVSQLSGGMKRRVSIACALIHSPKLVFFDEATVGLDPVLRKYFWEYFRSLKEEGVTLVVTSHVMDEAEKADRIGLMRAGKLIDEGTPAELIEKHQVKNIEEVFLKMAEGVEIEEK